MRLMIPPRGVAHVRFRAPEAAIAGRRPEKHVAPAVRPGLLSRGSAGPEGRKPTRSYRFRLSGAVRASLNFPASRPRLHAFGPPALGQQAATRLLEHSASKEWFKQHPVSVIREWGAAMRRM